MVDPLFEKAILIRLVVFLVILIIIASWELISPRRKLVYSKPVRWFSNLGIVLSNSLLLKILLPIAAVDFAVIIQKNHWGLLNYGEISLWVKVFTSVILLDLAIYLQHILFHKVPVLWRFHRMHHTDLDVDVTTGIRFHPFEIVLSMLIKLVVIVLIGAPALGVLVFEILLNATSMFNHGNIYISKKIDRLLRFFVVTPDMHRVHHSILQNETNSNFGFNLPWWDRIFRTYLKAPKKKQEQITIGIDLFRNPKYLKLHWLLILPFLSGKQK